MCTHVCANAYITGSGCLGNQDIELLRLAFGSAEENLKTSTPLSQNISDEYVYMLHTHTQIYICTCMYAYRHVHVEI